MADLWASSCVAVNANSVTKAQIIAINTDTDVLNYSGEAFNTALGIEVNHIANASLFSCI